jgi:glycosyltransferase involved in cell wall biosynthesis
MPFQETLPLPALKEKVGQELTEISFVVPVVERHDDLIELYKRFSHEASKITERYEFIFVIDDGFERAYEAAKSLRAEDPRVRVIRLQGQSGEATALMVGFEKARGNLIFTLSAYFQVDATEFEKVYLALKDKCDLVITRRFPRRDSGVNRIQAAVFHWLISRMIGTSFKDISCGFRGMKRIVLENLCLYADLHRFLPALAVKSGFRVSEVKVKQDTRDLGIRLRGVGVYLRRLIDILTLFFLVKFTKKPLRFFGLVGSGLFGFGFLVSAYIAVWKLTGNAIAEKAYILLLAVLCLVLGLQTVFMGLIGEIIIFTHAREMKDYQIESLDG